jgi:uncharacterized protein YllA (UPF0747 family)
MSKEMLDAVSYTLTSEQIDSIAKVRNLANNEATRDTDARKNLRQSVQSAISFCLDLGTSEQIRRYEKAVKDAAEQAKQDAINLANQAAAAFMQRVAACKTDAERAKVISEYTQSKSK